jgi:hypothetical protein
MKEVTMGICMFDENDEVVARKNIGTNWSIDVVQDMQHFFNVSMINEIARILTENIKLQLTQEVVKEMVIELRDKSNG